MPGMNALLRTCCITRAAVLIQAADLCICRVHVYMCSKEARKQEDRQTAGFKAAPGNPVCGEALSAQQLQVAPLVRCWIVEYDLHLCL